MTEPQKTAGTEGTQTPEPEPTPPREAASGTDPDSLRRALAKQAEEFRANEAKLQKQLQAHESEKLKAKEAKMLEDGKLQELIADRDKRIADMEARAQAADRKLLESTARDQLRNLGMNDALYLQGALAGLPTDASAETIDAWAKTLKVDNPTAFTAPATPIKAADPGDPSTNAGGSDLESRLKSDDPKIRAAAFSEQLKKDLGEAL